MTAVAASDVKNVDRSQLKPSEVTTTSNIFGEINDDDLEEVVVEDNDESSSDIAPEDDFELEASSSEEEQDDEDTAEPAKKRKKNDPDDFASAMSKILASGLSTSKRSNPILARSIESKKLDEATQDERLTTRVKKQINTEKRKALAKNHNPTVVGETDEEQARIIERERQLRKVAQRGVVKLFNAIRASQTAGSIQIAGPTKKRDQITQETSKATFLDMIKGKK